VSSPGNAGFAAGPLANQALLDSIRDALSSGPDATESMVFGIGLLAFFLLISVAARCLGRERHTSHERRVNYLTLAVDLLGLSEAERRDLETLARLAGFEQPAAIMLSPANLARAVARTAAAPQHDRLHERAEQLCLRLFGSRLPAPEPEARHRLG